MATTTVIHYATGQSQYTIPFDYLARKFVIVSLRRSTDLGVDDVLTPVNDYKFLNATTIEILAPTAGYDTIQIKRFTGTDLVVGFRDGSVLTAANLTNAELQAIHIAEEGREQTLITAEEFVTAAREYATQAAASSASALQAYQNAKDLIDSAGDKTALLALSSPDAGKGDAFVTVVQPLAAAIARSLHSKMLDIVSVKDFGAIGDGVHDDTDNIQAALDSGYDVYIPKGVFVCTKPLVIRTQGQRIHGAGRGYGYNSNVVRHDSGVDLVPKWSSAIFNYQHTSTLYFKGTGIKQVLTRVLHRSSAADPQDDAMSVCVNVQAEGTTHEDYCIYLDITPPAGGPAAELTDSIDNLGADWDVGLFVASRCNTTLRNLSVIGYHRKANIWFDVTQAINLPRFPDPKGGNYPQQPVENGADGCFMDSVFTSGGLWGVNIQGAKLKAGETTYTTPYYDQQLGQAVPDSRGSWGFSDFAMINCQIFGANHHTRRRLVDMKPTPNAETDWDVGGAMSVDGFTLNTSSAVHGHRYVSCRFQSWAPFTVRIDHSARDDFFGCMIENPNFEVCKSRDGSTLTLSPATAFYGLCATKNHRFLSIVTSQAPTSTAYTTLGYGDAQFANNSQANPITRTPYGRLEVLAKDATDTSVLRLGIIGSPSLVQLYRATTGSMVSVSNGSFVWQNSAGQLKLSIAPSGNVQLYGNIYGDTDNTRSLGDASHRFTNVYAANGSIITSDERYKTEIVELDQKEREVAREVKKLFRRYRMKDAIEEKKSGARFHIGVIAQHVVETFARFGLDAQDYGLLCYDQWNDEFEPIMEAVTGPDGEVIYRETGSFRKTREAGERYGIRYDELLCFIVAAM